MKLKTSAASAAILTLAISAQSQAESYAPKDNLYLVCGPALVLIKKADAWLKLKDIRGGKDGTLIKMDIRLLRPGKIAESPKAGWNSGKVAEAYSDHFRSDDVVIDRASGTLMSKAKFNDPSHEDESFTCKKSSKSEHSQLVQSHNAEVGGSKF